MERRHEIDGLRALAVIPVVWFHAGLPGLPAGFVGVDVFYVISGFLITRVILREGFRLTDFYERRARRLFPALFVMVAATAIAAGFVLMPFDFVPFAKSAIAALTFTANFWFWHATNYFAPGSYVSPLLHTWSLGVEEQFYVVYPAFLLLARRLARRRLLPVLIAAWILSFAGCLAVSGWRPEAAFYLLPFRGWELLTGAIASQLPSLRGPRAAALGLGSIATLIAGYALIGDPATYPNALALIPTLAAAGIIVSEGAGATWLLASRPVVWIGRISYSLYLWHWPIFALWRYRFEQAPSVPVTLGLICLTFFVSHLSWRFIEEPVRQRRWLPSRLNIGATSVACVAGLGALFLAGVATAGFPSRFSAQVETIEAAAYDQNLGCSYTPSGKMTLSRLCHLGVPGRPRLVIWGDSHAWALRGVFNRAMATDGLAGALASRGGCPPGLGLDRMPPVCAALNRATVDMIEREGISSVVITANWSGYEARQLTLDARPAESTAVLMTALGRAVDELQARGVQVILVDPIPGARDDVPRLLAQRTAYGLSLPLAFTVAEYRAANASFFDFVRAHPGLGRIQLAQAYCNAADCPATVDGDSSYVDAHHVRLSSNRGLDVIKRDLTHADGGRRPPRADPI